MVDDRTRLFAQAKYILVKNGNYIVTVVHIYSLFKVLAVLVPVIWWSFVLKEPSLLPTAPSV